jgi:hypothetical protein
VLITPGEDRGATLAVPRWLEETLEHAAQVRIVGSRQCLVLLLRGKQW